MFGQTQAKEKLKPQSTTYGLKIFAAEGLFFTELSCKLSPFLFGKEGWTSVKKTAVLEPLYWLQNGEIARMCMRKRECI